MYAENIASRVCKAFDQFNGRFLAFWRALKSKKVYFPPRITEANQKITEQNNLFHLRDAVRAGYVSFMSFIIRFFEGKWIE